MTMSVKRTVCVVALLLGVASAAPASASDFWRLDFNHTGLHYIIVDDGVNGKVAMAYTTYTVTNKTDKDIDFAPTFTVETDTGQVTYGIPSPGIVRAIDAKHGKTFLDVNQIAGSIKPGETKQGVAVFRRLDPKADNVKLYISGLTDAYRYQKEDERQGFQRKVWYIHWYRPGDVKQRPEDRVQTKHDGWIWRSTSVGQTAPEA